MKPGANTTLACTSPAARWRSSRSALSTTLLVLATASAVDGGACVVSERDQFYALLHGALADGARIQARYADALESMARRVGDDAAAAVTNGTVAALAAHLAAFLESCGYLESTGAEALGRLAREADYPLPTYVKNA